MGSNFPVMNELMNKMIHEINHISNCGYEKNGQFFSSLETMSSESRQKFNAHSSLCLQSKQCLFVAANIQLKQ